MTKERQALIDRFQKWLDTKPREQIISAQCATIAEEYADQLLIQRVVVSEESLCEICKTEVHGYPWDICRGCEEVQ